MTTTSHTPPPASALTRQAPPYRITPARVLRSEWHKLPSLRSTWTTLATAAALVLGVGLIMGGTYTSGGGDADVDTVVLTVYGSLLDQLCVIVLGILVTAGEYATGMIRSSLTAVPTRLPQAAGPRLRHPDPGHSSPRPCPAGPVPVGGGDTGGGRSGPTPPRRLTDPFPPDAPQENAQATDHPTDANLRVDVDAHTAPPAQAALSGPAPDAAPLTRTIRSGLDRLRAFDRRRPLAWDAAVTAFWAVAAVLDYTSAGWRNVAHDVTAPEPLVLLMSLCFSLPLLLRRRYPMAVLPLMAPVSLVNVWTGAVVQAALVQLIPALKIALRLPLRRLGVAGLVLCAPVVAGATRIPDIWDRQLVSYL